MSHFHRVIAVDEDGILCFQCGSRWNEARYEDQHTVDCQGPDGPHVGECECDCCRTRECRHVPRCFASGDT